MDILFISLGCDKNLADTEMMLGILQKRALASRMMKKRRIL